MTSYTPEAIRQALLSLLDNIYIKQVLHNENIFLVENSSLSCLSYTFSTKELLSYLERHFHLEICIPKITYKDEPEILGGSYSATYEKPWAKHFSIHNMSIPQVIQAELKQYTKEEIDAILPRDDIAINLANFNVTEVISTLKNMGESIFQKDYFYYVKKEKIIRYNDKAYEIKSNTMLKLLNFLFGSDDYEVNEKQLKEIMESSKSDSKRNIYDVVHNFNKKCAETFNLPKDIKILIYNQKTNNIRLDNSIKDKITII